MQSYLRRVIETEAHYTRNLPVMGCTASRNREHLSDAHYYSPAPRVRELLAEQADQRNIHCQHHHRVGETRCVDCGAPICPDCEYLLINGRPWCVKCGERHRTSLTTDLLLALMNTVKAALLVAAVIGIVQYAPLTLEVRIFSATCVGLLGAWLMFAGEDAEPEVRVVRPRRQRAQLRRVVRYPYRASGVSRG